MRSANRAISSAWSPVEPDSSWGADLVFLDSFLTHSLFTSLGGSCILVFPGLKVKKWAWIFHFWAGAGMMEDARQKPVGFPTAGLLLGLLIFSERSSLNRYWKIRSDEQKSTEGSELTFYYFFFLLLVVSKLVRTEVPEAQMVTVSAGSVSRYESLLIFLTDLPRSWERDLTVIE